MKPTNDGGFTIAGQTQGSSNNANLWLIKTDSEGNEEWNSYFSHGNHAVAQSVVESDDGGFTLTGWYFYSTSNNLIMLKTDSGGNEEWNRVYGSNDGNNEFGYSIIHTMDGGQYTEYYHEVHQLNAQHYITAGLLGSDAYLMKFIIPWCPVDLWETFYYVFIEQMMMNQLPINLIYDIDYDGNLDVMDMLIAADVMDESIDTPYDCRE